MNDMSREEIEKILPKREDNTVLFNGESLRLLEHDEVQRRRIAELEQDQEFLIGPERLNELLTAKDARIAELEINQKRIVATVDGMARLLGGEAPDLPRLVDQILAAVAIVKVEIDPETQLHVSRFGDMISFGNTRLEAIGNVLKAADMQLRHELAAGKELRAEVDRLNPQLAEVREESQREISRLGLELVSHQEATGRIIAANELVRGQLATALKELDDFRQTATTYHAIAAKFREMARTEFRHDVFSVKPWELSITEGIVALRSELNEARAENETRKRVMLGFRDHTEKQDAELASLRLRVQEGEADTNRLDWISERFVVITPSGEDGKPPKHWIVDPWDSEDGASADTLRASLDKAMAQ